MAPNKAGQGTLSIEVIKQFPGRETADRRVQVQVPGKFFPQLQTGEQNAIYWGEAVSSSVNATSFHSTEGVGRGRPISGSADQW